MKAHIFLFLVSLLTAPWINPFAPGPSPAVVPLVVAWFCAATVLVTMFCKMQVRELMATVSWSWLVAGLFSCAIGLLQYFGAATDFSPWINQTQYGEAVANLRQRNQFATLTNIAMAALLWLVVQPQTHNINDKRRAAAAFWFAFAAAGLLMIGNALSSSRTGLFELVLLCGLYSLWGHWQHASVRRVLVWAVLVYGIAVFAMPYLAGLDLSQFGVAARLSQDDTCASRLILWSNVLNLIEQKPWLGWGWGELDYAHFITLYNAPRFCDILDNAHNLPLHLAVELGVPLALMVCGGFSWWVWRQRPWAERDATRQMAWAVMAVILLHSMLEYPLWYGPFQMAFGACFLLLWYQKPSLDVKNSSEKTSNRPVPLILCAPAAIISIAFIAYAMWDYRRISQIYLQPEARDAYYRSDTLAKIRNSWLFADQVRFAELMITPLSPANAAWTFSTATALLHYSPESRVVEKLIESAVMLGRDDEAMAYLARYRVAFPKEYALWSKANAIFIAPPDAKPN